MTKKRLLPLALLSQSLLLACGGGSSSEDNTETVSTISGYNSALFSTDLISDEQVSCTLENGVATTCYQLRFAANGAGTSEDNGTIGPFCPENINVARKDAGVGIYDGPTNPGFQSLVDAVQNMDADGYDVVDENGNVNSVGGGGGNSACLEMPMDTGLEITYLIPISPQVRSVPYEISTIESIGFGVTGVPYKGHPPGVAVAEAGVNGSGSGSIPALDHCGGHVDPAGYYHWHFVPQSMNTVLSADEYEYQQDHELSCSNSIIAYDQPSAFAGLAKDGYPIYGAYDDVNSVNKLPNEVAAVDECNGHSHATTDFPDGIYHYHALESGAPNVPSCLHGSFVRQDFYIQ